MLLTNFDRNDSIYYEEGVALYNSTTGNRDIYIDNNAYINNKKEPTLCALRSNATYESIDIYHRIQDKVNESMKNIRLLGTLEWKGYRRKAFEFKRNIASMSKRDCILISTRAYDENKHDKRGFFNIYVNLKDGVSFEMINEMFNQYFK